MALKFQRKQNFVQNIWGISSDSITLKGASGRTFEEAMGMLRNIIGNEAMRFQFLLQSKQLTEIEHKRYEALINIDKTGSYTMSDELLKDSFTYPVTALQSIIIKMLNC